MRRDLEGERVHQTREDKSEEYRGTEARWLAAYEIVIRSWFVLSIDERSERF